MLGKTPVYPSSGCPEPDRCEVVARVTGIQMKAEGVEHPFRAPVDGRLVAWWLKLPRLRSTQIQSFNGLFGGEPAARIAVLRRGKRAASAWSARAPTQPLRADLDGKGRRALPPVRASGGQGRRLHRPHGGDVAARLRGEPRRAGQLLAGEPRQGPLRHSAAQPAEGVRGLLPAHAGPAAAEHREACTECTYQTARLLYWAPDRGRGTRVSRGRASP